MTLSNGERRIAYYAVELVVVFFGVMAAFSLDRYAEYRRDLATERQYLESMAAEITSDTLELDDYVAELKDRLSFTEEVIAEIDRHNLADSVGRAYASAVLSQTMMLPGTSAWDALVSSGDLKLIRNHELRMQIATLYSHYEGLAEAGKLVLNHTMETSVPSVMGTVDFASGRFYKHTDPNDPTLRNSLIFVVNLGTTYATMLDSARLQAEKTLSMIESELAPR